jgi:hypothetical protein
MSTRQLLEIAQIYTDLVNADNDIPDSEYRAKDLVGALRTKYHNILMEHMLEEGIDFVDRFDATRIAFDFVKKEGIHSP